MFELHHACVGYGGEPVLRDVSFAAQAGQITTLVGPNGCGKTTLLKALAGQLPLLGGEACLRGRPIREYNRREFARTAAFMPQVRNIPEITVRGLVSHGRFPYLGLSRQMTAKDREVVQNLLKVTKLDTGTVTMEKKPESVAEMMGALQRQFAYRAAQEDKQFVCTGDDALVLPCDRVWLLEAIGNLVKNAFDHTQAGDTVRVEWRGFASIVQIVVRDNGSGIHPEDLPHIFKRFYRSRFSGDAQGLGLGLPLAKAVIEAHNGTIEVDSAPGAGTVFTVNFLIPTKL